MQHFKQFLFICITILPILTSSAHAVTDTIFVQKRITDTLYVVSPPDTVYIQETMASQTKTDEIEKNPFLLEYSTDTIAPAKKIYIGGMTFLNLFSIWFGIPILDFYYEIENEHRGSFMFSFSSLMLFQDVSLRDEDPSWEGFRSIISPGFGYRQYLFSFSVSKTNPKKLKIAYRNTPLYSLSFYTQAAINPTFKIAYDKKFKDSSPKKGSFDAGISASATLGSVWNMSNMLWDTGLTFGYQYWSDNSRKFLGRSGNADELNYHLLNGWCGKGFFIGMDIKLGF
ncbi:hypothetical protein [Fibrobacter sp.]|uniref:hypothetical protein n=1 Tax=Fibrobacter sp. TaxID=35828 RepID=UPI0025B9DE5F|nr:hypothetical protein [Fibrobacter sp.]MBR3071204.1 hypothetical protein [Fibrobacter sp.]